MPLPEGFVLENKSINLPEGFVLEKEETPKTEEAPKQNYPTVGHQFGAVSYTGTTNMFDRFGRQFYNVAVAQPALAVGTQSEFGKLQTDINALKIFEEKVKTKFEQGEPLTLSEIEDFKPQEIDWLGRKLGLYVEPWRRMMYNRYLEGSLPIKEEEKQTSAEIMQETKELYQEAYAQTFKDANISLAVKEASNSLEKAVDVMAGVAGFTAQLYALRKAFPGMPEIGIWELQSQATGNAPGSGALTYSIFSIPGKVIPGKTLKGKAGQLASESALLAGLTALEGGDKTDILISAGIPIGMKALKIPALLKNLQTKNPKLAATLSVQPDFFYTYPKADTAIPVKMNNVIWNKRHGGDNRVNLHNKMNQLLIEAHRAENRNYPNKEAVLDNISTQMNLVHKKLIKLRNLKRNSNKDLIKLCKQNNINVPKKATRETLIELLKGEEYIFPIKNGFIIKDIVNPENKFKPATKDSPFPKKYKTLDEAKQALFNQEINLTAPVSGIDSVIQANTRASAKTVSVKTGIDGYNETGTQLVNVYDNKTWINSQVGKEVNQLAKETNTSPEYIIGNIQLQEIGRKTLSRFPAKINDQKSFKSWGKKVLDHFGMGDWNIKLKMVDKIPSKLDPTGRALGFADLDNPTDLSRGKRSGTIYIKKPTNEKFSISGLPWIPTPTQAGQVERGMGQASRHTQGWAKRAFIHELSHFLEPGQMKSGGIEVHTPEFVNKTNSLVKQLFEIRKKVKPVSESIVRLSDQPGVTIPPGSNVYRTKSGKVIVETPADIGTKQKTVMKEGRVYERATGEELTQAFDLMPSGRLSRNSMPPDYQPVKKTEKRKGKKIKVRGKSTVEIIKRWKVEEYKPAKGKWEATKAETRKKRNAAAVSFGNHLKELGVPQEEINRLLKSKFKGEFRKPQIKPPDLANEQWNGLAERINQVYKGKAYDITTAQSGLDKIRSGRIPQNSELHKLTPIFGSETVRRLSEGFDKIRTHGPVAKAQFIRDMWKVKFGWDIQSARQLSKIAVTHPRIFATAVKINAFSYASKKQANKFKHKIEQNPTFRLAQEKYGVNMLWTKPWKKTATTKLEQYGNVSGALVKSKSKVIHGVGKILQASERGANLGIDWALTRLVEQAETNLNKLAKKNNWSQSQIDKWRLERGKDINALTKRFVAKSPKGQQVQAALNWVWLSPSWTISRPYADYRAIRNLFKGSPGNRTFAIKTTLSHLGAMYGIGLLGSWLASKSLLNDPTKEPVVNGTTDPSDSMWGKLRVGNDVLDFTSGDAGWYRLLARIGISAYAKIKETATGEMVTKVAGKPVRQPGEEIERYLQSRETIVLGLGKTLLTGKDWLGNDMPRYKAILKEFPMESLVSIVEAGIADGLWEDMLQKDPGKVAKDLTNNLPIGVIGMLGGGTTTYPVSPYSTRANFRDIVAQESYKKSWNDLNPSQVRRLEKKYKTEFNKFESQIKEYKVENPPNSERIKEEVRKAGDRVRKNLSVENQLKVKGTTLGLSRRPKKFYLNDERYNRYIELYTEILDDLLDRKTNPNQKIVDSYKTIAKNRAYYKLKKEIE